MSSQSPLREFVGGNLLDPQRRNTMRFPLDVPVVYWWQDAKGEHQGEGRVYDVSELGVFVLASACPPAGTQVSAKISIAAVPYVPRALRMQVEGRVLRVEQVGSGDRRDGFAILSDQAILHEGNKSTQDKNSQEEQTERVRKE
jgi:hypothetical protein